MSYIEGVIPPFVVALVAMISLTLLCCLFIDDSKDDKQLLETSPAYKLNIIMPDNNLASVVVIDGHEYIVISRGRRVSGITHKANCKFCTDSKPY